MIHSGISQGKRKSEERNNESGSMGLWAMDMDMAKYVCRGKRGGGGKKN